MKSRCKKLLRPLSAPTRVAKGCVCHGPWVRDTEEPRPIQMSSNRCVLVFRLFSPTNRTLNESPPLKIPRPTIRLPRNTHHPIPLRAGTISPPPYYNSRRGSKAGKVDRKLCKNPGKIRAKGTSLTTPCGVFEGTKSW